MSVASPGTPSPSDGGAAAPMLTLQSVIFPEQGVCTEPELFYRLRGPALLRERAGEIELEPGAEVHFDTWFNALSIGKWRRACRVEGLHLGLRGRGLVEVRAFLAVQDQSWERLCCEVVELRRDEETRIDLSHFALNDSSGVIWFELRAIAPTSGAILGHARFLAPLPEGVPGPVDLAVCLEAPAAATETAPAAASEAATAEAGALAGVRMARLLAGLGSWGTEAGAGTGTEGGGVREVFLAGGLPESGAAATARGRLTRLGPGTGLAEAVAAAQAAGHRHALLIDAGAALPLEALKRAQAFLTLARTPQAALTASPMHPTERWRAEEIAWRSQSSGGDTSTPALFRGADLRKIDVILEVEHAGTALAPDALVPHPGFLACALTPLDAAALAAAGPGTEAGTEPGTEAAVASGAVPGTAGRDDERAQTPTARIARAAGLELRTLNGIMLRPAPQPARRTAWTTLQNLIFPDPAISTEYDTFFHIGGPGFFDASLGEVTLEEGATAFFDSYFNALSIGKWHAFCAPKRLHLALRGRGRVEVKVFHAIPDRSWEILVSEVVTLTPAQETLFDLSHYPQAATRGVIYFEARALAGRAAISAGRYVTASRPDPSVRLAASITTFRREAQVEATAARLVDWIADAEMAERLHLFVVDNGQSASLPASPFITHVPNANLGGAGGFTRGLIEAKKAGYSHVLFMDDDATFPMENLHRTVTFLALSQDPKATIAGAMINTSEKWRMWENGATFDRKCMPLFTGTDLRTREGVMHLEFESARVVSDKLYGGWWYFAFPVAQVTHYPFPFFVRGDDVNFSLANDFNIVTLNGVVSFAEDFFEKESPLTWYLDLRSHMVHHLTLDKMEVGPLALAKMVVWFFLRNVPKFQYESIEAVLMAFEDVMRGPEVFAANPDAADRRARIKALSRTEAWKPLSPDDMVERRRFWAGHGWRCWLSKITLNGHLMPFAGVFGNRIVLPPQERNHYAAMWGASRITFLNTTRDKGYTTRLSRRRFARVGLRLTGLLLRFLLGYRALRAAYRDRYDDITTPRYWDGALALKGEEQEAEQSGPAPETDAVTDAGTDTAADAGTGATTGADPGPGTATDGAAPDPADTDGGADGAPRPAAARA